MSRLRFDDLKKVKPGDRVIYDGHISTIYEAPEYLGGLAASGMSLPYILEHFDYVELIDYRNCND